MREGHSGLMDLAREGFSMEIGGEVLSFQSNLIDR